MSGGDAENEASRCFFEGLGFFNRGSWDLIAALLEPDMVSEDHRRLVARTSTSSAEDWLATIRTVASVGYTRASGSVVALRGQRHALVSTTFATPEGTSTDQLNVMALSEEGRIERGDVFDADDLDAALAHLDHIAQR